MEIHTGPQSDAHFIVYVFSQASLELPWVGTDDVWVGTWVGTHDVWVGTWVGTHDVPHYNDLRT